MIHEKLGEQRGAEPDHDAAEHQRPEHAPVQDAVLVGERHAEVAEDQRDHDHVVERERVLDDVAGQVLQHRVPAVELLRRVRRDARPVVLEQREDHAGERERERDVEEGPGQRLARADHARRAVEDAQIHGEEHEDQRQESGPDQHGHSLNYPRREARRALARRAAPDKAPRSCPALATRRRVAGSPRVCATSARSSSWVRSSPSGVTTSTAMRASSPSGPPKSTPGSHERQRRDRAGKPGQPRVRDRDPDPDAGRHDRLPCQHGLGQHLGLELRGGGGRRGERPDHLVAVARREPRQEAGLAQVREQEPLAVQADQPLHQRPGERRGDQRHHDQGHEQPLRDDPVLERDQRHGHLHGAARVHARADRPGLAHRQAAPARGGAAADELARRSRSRPPRRRARGRSSPRSRCAGRDCRRRAARRRAPPGARARAGGRARSRASRPS